MKPSTKPISVQPPRLPKHLQAATLARLEDHAEYAALELNGCDFSEQAAQDILFEQVRLRRAVFTRSRLSRVRLGDVKLEGSDLSGANWEKARFHRAEFNGCRCANAAST